MEEQIRKENDVTEEIKENKNKEILKKVGKNIILSGCIISLLTLNLNLFKKNKNNEEKDEPKLKFYVKYLDESANENVLSNYVEIYESLMNNPIEEEIEDNEIKDEENTNNTEQIITDEVKENDDDNNNLTILKSAGIYSNLDNMAEEYNEELIIHENEKYIQNVLDLIYDINNDGISKEHKLNFICQIYNCSYEDIYFLYQIFLDSINENPTINPYDNIRNICNYIIQKDNFNIEKNNIINKYNLFQEDITNNTNELINSYLNDQIGNTCDILINTLYYKQINNIPLETKLDYIYKRWDINEKQLIVIIECVLCEATHHSYIDAYAVISTLMNRMSSIKWTMDYDNIYDQLTNRFGVYYRGDYKCYEGLTLEELIDGYEGATAVVNCLYEELPTVITTNFYGNGYESRNKTKLVEGGNNYFNENDQLSSEDTIPAEERQKVVFEENIVLTIPEKTRNKNINSTYEILMEEENGITLNRTK